MENSAGLHVEEKVKKRSSRKLLNIIKYAFFLLGGIGIFFWVYRGQSPTEIWTGLRRFDYGWIILSFFLALLSHFFRALRWRMLIQPLGFNPRISNTFLAILIMYLANYALPRLGEVTRCGILKKYEKVPFTAQLGTVVVERAVDFVVLLILLLVVLLMEWTRISTFLMSQQLDSSSMIVRTFTSGLIYWMFALMIIFILMIWLFRNALLRFTLFRKLAAWFKKFVEGIKSIKRLKYPLWFIVLTLLIYSLYFGMTYTVCKAFEPTHSLGFAVALSVLTLGSVGMVIPVQGGIGTYHFFTVETLVLFGVGRADSQLLAFVLHGSMSLFLIMVGAIALIILPWINNKTRSKTF